VYALRAADGTLRVVLDDMQPRGEASSRRGRPPSAPVRVTLRLTRAYRHGSVVELRAPSIFAKRDVTLGGQSLGADGSLPAAVARPIAGGSGRFVLQVMPASAAVVTLAP
jgi:hypothetical protein